MKIFSVKKSVEWGPAFIEYRYDEKGTGMIGRWAHYGSSMVVNPSNKHLVCDYCVRDTNARLQNYGSLERSFQPSLYPDTSPIRSYRVPGVTKASDYYEWSLGVCNNPEKGACWGNRYEYLFDVQRRQVGEGSGVTQYRFTTSRMLNGLVNKVDQLYIKVERASDYNYTTYRGIGSKLQSIPDFFWPGLFSRESKGSMFYVFLEINTNSPIPEGLRSKSNISWPYEYRNREYENPLRADFFFYKISDLKLPIPKTLAELHENHHPFASTFLDFYPGGCGMKVRQFLFVENTEETRKWDLDWTQQQTVRSFYDDRGDWLYTPDWMKGRDESYVMRRNVFIPGYQSGMAGPFDSFYERINDTPVWFSG